MSITVARLLRHMAWANQETIKHLQTLPEESLKAYATNPEWFVAEIAHPVSYTHLTLPTSDLV